MTNAMLLNQLDQLKNPDARIVLGTLPGGITFSQYVTIYYGSKPGQTSRTTKLFFELPHVDQKLWIRMETTPTGQQAYTGKTLVCMEPQQASNNGISEFNICGSGAWGKRGFIISQMRNLYSSLYVGKIFDNNTRAVIPIIDEHSLAVAAYIWSDEFTANVRALNQKLDVAREVLDKVPFDLERWQKVADERYPDGLPEPHSDDPTQWLFRGDIPSSTAPLQVAMARLLGYHWPDQPQDELNAHTVSDGILPLTPLVGNEAAAARLRALLQQAYQSPAPMRPRGAPAVTEPRRWDETVLPRLLAAAGTPGKTLEEWLRIHFFEQHCALFGQRPFLWHIWDGHKEGFSAIVNYHRLDARTLERLTHVYLGEWIERQTAAIADGDSTATSRLAAAQTLKTRLEAIRIGEDPYDIYVRWKPLHEQPLGWQPDINDGVRLNIRPFVTAGVLRAKVNVHWNKDRGTDPERNAGGTTERLNDLHFTNQQKRDARAARSAT